MYHYLIVGAGLSGAVCARMLADSGKKVLIIDKRNHVGGNTYDEYDEYGVLIHKYGPHIFHTNEKRVVEYLSRFTDWTLYEHRVRASIDGKLVPMPINLDTVNQLYNLNLDAAGLAEFFKQRAEPIEVPKNSEDVVVGVVGRELFEKFFEGYTLKQWSLHPRDLDASVTARVPIRFNRDDRYFADKYQMMPRAGYTKMVQNMLDHENIHIMLNTPFQAIRETIAHEKLIFTGPVDEYFHHELGKLPYRSLRFEFETVDRDSYQDYATVNYPNSYDFTRISEFKKLTGQSCRYSTVVREYPMAEGEPYYPIPAREGKELYQKYKDLAEKTQDVIFLGRLGRYSYMNMDKVVLEALNLSDGLV